MAITEQNNNLQNFQIYIKGRVQGVGFRPFIYKIAKTYQVNGWIKNQNDGLLLNAEGQPEKIESFIQTIIKNAPQAARITDLKTQIIPVQNFSSFKIQSSENISSAITEICPDLAVCRDCLHDLKAQKHRLDYAFINCTNCGPRFSIIKTLPYDRENTTMAQFKMCDTCNNEYNDISNRRFHAQPVACNNCGPVYFLNANNNSYKKIEDIVYHTAKLLDTGQIAAIRGTGGFHLACDAFNDKAVKNLRQKKDREGKPFAVMCKDMETVRKLAIINTKEQDILQSIIRPIVLLKLKPNPEINKLSKSVSSGMDTIGIFLPYMPFHYLLFEQIQTSAIVLTSGNRSENPIIIRNDKAKTELKDIADAFVLHNREIYNRTDDSVVMVVNSSERLIRRSRGYAPEPIILPFNVDGILALGPELKNTFCLGKDNMAIISQHIGDLKNMATYDFYQQTISRYLDLFRVKPQIIAKDMHPLYLSTRFADQFDNLTQVDIQHHHAHLASCMAENNIRQKVIGISLDGTGYGTDGQIWGGEIFLCDLENFIRKKHFAYVEIVGGDKSIKEPWRLALAYLYHTFGKKFQDLKIPFVKHFSADKKNSIHFALENKINTIQTSSLGRFFDAVAAMLEICLETSYDAEGPMKLESILDETITDEYPFSNEKEINIKNIISSIVKDIEKKVDNAIIATRFHNTIISILLKTADEIKGETQINKIALSGGVLQNRYLLKNLEIKLRKMEFEVFSQKKVPANDGGVSFGQVAIAAMTRNKGGITV